MSWHANLCRSEGKVNSFCQILVYDHIIDQSKHQTSWWRWRKSQWLKVITIHPLSSMYTWNKFHNHQFNRWWHISVTMMVAGDRQSQWDTSSEDHECMNKIGQSWETIQLFPSGQWFRSLKFILYDFECMYFMFHYNKKTVSNTYLR